MSPVFAAVLARGKVPVSGSGQSINVGVKTDKRDYVVQENIFLSHHPSLLYT